MVNYYVEIIIDDVLGNSFEYIDRDSSNHSIMVNEKSLFSIIFNLFHLHKCWMLHIVI